MTIHEHNQNFVNMTPHDINMVDNGGTLLFTIPPSGETIRLSEEWGPLGEFTFDEEDCVYTIPIECVQMKFDAIILPPVIDNTWYIVSRAVCQAFPNRTDFLMVGKTIRDEKGRICGAKCFSQLF